MKLSKALLLVASVALLASCDAPGPFKLGLGGEGVPVGQYSSKILQYFGVDEEALKQADLVSYGKDVKAVTTYIKEGLVSCGIIYKTDAFSAKLTVVDTATEEMTGGKVIYPAAAIKNAAGKKDAANSFITYLTNVDAMTSFKAVGFDNAVDPISETTQVSANITLNVYAAASLTETLNEIKTKYETAHPNVTLAIAFGSSGALQTNIENAPDDCDVFISAAQKQMNALASKSLIEEDTRINLLENKVALAVGSNPYGITSFEGLANKLKESLQSK